MVRNRRIDGRSLPSVSCAHDQRQRIKIDTVLYESSNFDLHTYAVFSDRSFIPKAYTTNRRILELQFDYNTTTIRRYHDAFDYDGSDRNYDLHTIRLRYDCDTITTRLRRKTDMLIFCSRRKSSNRIEWKQARAIRVVGS